MIRQIEEFSLNAWPSLQTITYDGWLIRFANGYTKRANSVNPIYPSTEEVSNKIDFCETLFRDRNLAPVFKLTNAVSPEMLDSDLEQRGYVAMDHTSVQVLSLSRISDPLMHAVKMSESLNEEWLKQICLLNNHNERSRNTMEQMFAVIVPRTCFLSLWDNGEAVACGLGVLERGYLGIFDVITDPRQRNRGFGGQLMLNLMKWGKENGAECAYLQVMLNNAPALRLYSKLGFTELYRYWYRIKTQVPVHVIGES